MPEQVELIKVARAGVAFNRRWAVRNVSFSLGAGEVLGLVGPNGAGKTTLLRALAGIIPLTTGEVHLMGQNIRDEDVLPRAHLGFTSDTPPLYKDMTVSDFLFFIARGYNIPAPEARERVGYWLDRVWLSNRATSRISTLSTGMRQRVGLARAMLPDPTVLLLDEAAAGLDPGGRVHFRELLCELRAQHKAIVVSSHVLSEMGSYCTHLAIMQNGALIKCGPVDQIIGAQSARCTYDLLLAESANGIEATLTAIDGLSNVKVYDEHVRFEFSADPKDAAALLAQLISGGIRVAGFGAEQRSIEKAYLQAGLSQVN